MDTLLDVSRRSSPDSLRPPSFNNGNPDFYLPGTPLANQFGRSLDIIQTPSASGGGGASTIYPFDAYLSAGTATYAVQPGTINGLLPSNYNSTFTLTPGTTYYLVLNVTTSGGQVTGATLAFNTSAPAAIPVNAGQPPTSFSFLIGVLLVGATSGTWYRTIGPGSLSAAGQLSYQANATSPSPGTLPYTNYYTWVVTQA